MRDSTSDDPIDVLVEDPDPLARARAHTELGLRAKAREQVDLAVFHLREALDLDPTDETPRDVLRSLGRTPDATVEPPPPRTVFGRILGGLRRRTTTGAD